MELGVDNPLNPISLTTDLDFKDTGHFALGAQYRFSDPWVLNFGVAYASDVQWGDVSPLLPSSAWRFDVGGQQEFTRPLTGASRRHTCMAGRSTPTCRADQSSSAGTMRSSAPTPTSEPSS